MPSDAQKNHQIATAILTYHRVVGQSATPHEFYDVDVAHFRQQIDLLAHRVVRQGEQLLWLDGGQAVCLTFDDGTSDHAQVGRLLQQHGLTGTFFVVAGRIGAPGCLSAAQIRDLAAQGHRIGSHTMTHRQLPTLSDAEIADEIRTSRAVLEDLSGQTVDWLAPPGGSLCPRSRAIAEECGMRVIRTMDWGYAPSPLAGVVPALPVLRFYGLPGFRRLLDGRAVLWPYRVKRWAKNLLGADKYVALRNRLGG